MLGWAKGQLRRKRFEFSCNKKTTVQSVAFSIISWLPIRNDHRTLIKAGSQDLVEKVSNKRC
jgi:hypothetical protein